MKKRKMFSHNYILAWITVLLVGFSFDSNSQTEFIKRYDMISSSFMGTDTGTQSRFAQTSDGFVIVAKDGNLSDPQLLTLDHDCELTGINIKYDLTSAKTISVTAIESGTGVDGYLLHGVMASGGSDWSYLIRTDAFGSVMWSKQMDFELDDGTFREGQETHVMQVDDGNLVFVAEIEPETTSDNRHLVVLKINQATGSIIWNEKLNVASGNGFALSGILEGQPGHYYFYGGGVSQGRFIIHMTDSGTGTSSDLRFFNISNGISISSVIYDDEDLIVGGNTAGLNKMYVFRIDENLNNIESLGGVPNQCDAYDVTDYQSLLSLIVYNERVILTGTYSIEGEFGMRRYTSVLSSGGAVLNTSGSLITGFLQNHKNLFPMDDSFITAHFNGYYVGGTGGGHDLRFTSFSPLGNTCLQESLTVGRTQISNTANSPPLYSNAHNFHYYDLTVLREGNTNVRSVTCSDCITPEEVDPITTSTGGFALCELDSLDLIAPDGFLWHRWFFEGELVSTDDIYTIYDGGEYSVILTDSFGCEIELFITIEPKVDVSEIDGSVFCLGASFVLPSFDDGGSWSGPYVIGGPETFYFSPTEVGTFTITYCNPYGCCVDAEITIKDATIELLSVESTCDGGLDGSITVTSGGGFVNWILTDEFGSTTYLLGETVTFSDLAPGIYTVTATLPAPPNCSSSITVEIVESGWHKQTVNTTGTESANDIVTDSEGNVYVVGTFSETTEIEGGGNPNILVDSDGSTEGTMFLAKYDDCGTLLWAAHSSTATLCSGEGLILDESNGMVYVTGDLKMTAKFQSAESAFGLCEFENEQEITAPTLRSGYVAQYDMHTGCFYFAEEFSDGFAQSTTSITIDESSGRIFVGGSHQPSLTSPEKYLFVRKYGPDVDSGLLGTSNTLNTLIWAAYDNTSASSEWNQINNMDYDEHRHFLYAIGDYHGQVAVPSFSITHAGLNTDAFLLTIRDAGPSYTVYDLRGGNGDVNGFMTGEGIAVNDSTQALYLTGSYNLPNSNAFSFSGINTLGSLGVKSKSYMLSGHIDDVTTAWARHTYASSTSTGWARGRDVTQRNGDVIFCNEFSGNALSVAPGVGIGISYAFIGDSAASGHIGVISYTTSGVRNWVNVTESISPYSADDHKVNAITSAIDGKTFMAGSFRNTMSYNTGTPFSGDLLLSGLYGGYNACALRVTNSSGELKSAAVQETMESDFNDAINFKLWPNPNKGTFVVNVDDSEEATEVHVLDMYGSLVHKQILISATTEMSLLNLSKGIYFLKLIRGEASRVEKIVIQ